MIENNKEIKCEEEEENLFDGSNDLLNINNLNNKKEKWWETPEIQSLVVSLTNEIKGFFLLVYKKKFCL